MQQELLTRSLRMAPRVEIEISRLEVAKKELLKKERDVGAG